MALLASSLRIAAPPEGNADSTKECRGHTQKVELRNPDESEKRVVVGPGHERPHVGMHDAIQKRMRQAAGDTSEEYPQRSAFTSCNRRGIQELRDKPWAAEPWRADDDEAQNGRGQPSNRGTQERVKEAMHWVFLVEQVVERLAVDQHLRGCKGRPREHRSAHALDSKAWPEVEGREWQLSSPTLSG